MKTEETKRLEQAIWYATKKQGLFGCFEVTIGFGGKERVDYLTLDAKNDFRCYEIKVTREDFHSSCHNSFVGNFNYYVLPEALFKQIYEEIPDHIGVYTEQGGFVKSVKRAKRQQVDNPDVLKNSLLRSCYREAAKKIENENPLEIEQLRKDILQVTKERDEYRKQYWNLLQEIRARYGTRWNKAFL